MGFCSRTGSAVAVAVGPAPGVFAGRWTVDLSDPGVPAQLYHAAAGRPSARAEEFVRAGVETLAGVAAARLGELIDELSDIQSVGLVIGDHPLPEGLPIARILAAHPLMHAAEGQLYRDVLLDAAAARGLPAHGVSRGQAEALAAGDLAATVAALSTAAGRPWRREHKLAAVAALLAQR